MVLLSLSMIEVPLRTFPTNRNNSPRLCLNYCLSCRNKKISGFLSQDYDIIYFYKNQTFCHFIAMLVLIRLWFFIEFSLEMVNTFAKVKLSFLLIMNLAWSHQVHSINTDVCICYVSVVSVFPWCLSVRIEKGRLKDKFAIR